MDVMCISTQRYAMKYVYMLNKTHTHKNSSNRTHKFDMMWGYININKSYDEKKRSY